MEEDITTDNRTLEINSTLTAIEDEINQYREGNLTLKMCLDSIIQLAKELA